MTQPSAEDGAAENVGSDEEPHFDLSFVGPPGQLMRVSKLVRRMVAPNPGPFTFTGTCVYVVGEGDVAVIDPGPDDPAHVAAAAELRSAYQARTAATRGPRAVTGTEVGQRSLSHYDEVFGLPSPPPPARPDLQVVR